MDFYIQVGNPKILNNNNREDKTFSEAMKVNYLSKTQISLIFLKIKLKSVFI